MEENTFGRNIIIALIVIIGLGAGLYFFLHSNGTGTGSSSAKRAAVVAKPPEIAKPSIDPAALSPEEKKAYDALASWVPVVITNQPTISQKPQTIKLPEGWTAREDYLLTVVPETMPAPIRNFRTVIMRPPKSKSMSRDDAIFSTPDASDPYFKDRCHVGVTSTTCYGGKNPETKAVFALMFYFDK